MRRPVNATLAKRVLRMPADLVGMLPCTRGGAQTVYLNE